jgi:hypothetical protein
MTDLSSDTQIVLTSLTQSEYGLDPVDIPNEAARMARIAAITLRVAMNQLVSDEPNPGLSQFWDDEADREWQNNQHFRRKFLAIVDELEAIL